MKEEIQKIKKAVEYISNTLLTYGGGSIAQAVQEILYPPDPDKFMECDSCRAKAGSPHLCKGCLHNRDLIQRKTK